ncbi:hypothetical protein NY08_2628 [Rhodococcus sp. B7740]|nr:hypothetical protein NY08_2628 [Rhodococcus sp. B7740]
MESLQRELSGGSSNSHRGIHSDSDVHSRVEEDEYEDWRR